MNVAIASRRSLGPEVLGNTRLRVFRMDIGPGAEGHFDEDEVRRLVAQRNDAR